MNGNLGKKYLLGKNHGSNILRDIFNNKGSFNLFPNSIYENINPSMLKDYFSSGTDPFYYMKIVLVLFEKSNELS